VDDPFLQNNANPAFVDLDGDGDMDIMAGDYFGYFHYFQNIGTPSAPAFALYQLQSI
jgi:hypothetical protein